MIRIRTKHDHTYRPSNGNVRPGFYHARIFEYEESKSTDGDPMVVLTLGIYEQEDHEARHLHQECKYFHAITDKTQWKLEVLLAVLGLEFDADQDIVLNARMFTGRQVAVRTSMKPGKKGGIFTQIDDILARDKMPYYGPLHDEDYAKYNLDEEGVYIKKGTAATGNTGSGWKPGAAATTPAQQPAAVAAHWQPGVRQAQQAVAPYQQQRPAPSYATNPAPARQDEADDDFPF